MPADIMIVARQILIDLENDNDPRVIALGILGERERLRNLLRDPLAVRISYLRGDIACQRLIDEGASEATSRYQTEVERLAKREVVLRTALAPFALAGQLSIDHKTMNDGRQFRRPHDFVTSADFENALIARDKGD